MKTTASLLLIMGLFVSCTKDRCFPGKNPDCICTYEYAPVCGDDGKTYGNACEAECNGIKNYTPGECKVG